MLSSLIKKPSRYLLAPIHFRCADSKTYVPVRALKADRNVLFSIGQPLSVPMHIKLLTWTPLLVFMLQGIAYEWNLLAVGGSLFSFILGLYSHFALKKKFTHAVCEISVNKNLTRFKFKVTCNMFSREWENALLKARKMTYQEKFRQQLKNGTLKLSQFHLKRMKKYSEDKLYIFIDVYQSQREEIQLQLHASQIKSFRFATQKQVFQMIRIRPKGYTTSANSSVFENYSTDKEPRNILVMESHMIEDQKIILFCYIQQSLEKKYQEYLRALAEGKTIAII